MIKQWVAAICILWENGLIEKANFSSDNTRKGSIGVFRKVPFKEQKSLFWTERPNGLPERLRKEEK